MSKRKASDDISSKKPVQEEISLATLALPGTKSLFEAQKKGSKGIKKIQIETKKKTIIPKKNEYQSFRSIYGDNFQYSYTAKVLDFYKLSFKNWLWLLQDNYNILVYGIGMKHKLLMSFYEKNLLNEDVLYISGNNGNNSENNSNSEKTVISLLDTIAKEVLKLRDSNDTFENIEVYTMFLIGTLY